MKRTKLNIYRYTDFRSFLQDRLAELKREDKKYSQRYLADRLELSSRSYLTMILDGSRKLSDNLARKLPGVLKMTKEESVFFFHLVRYGQAKTTAERAEALEAMRRHRHFLQIHQLDLDHFDYLTDPLTVTLREMVMLKDFQEDPEWIAKRLPTRTSPARIQAALEQLEQMGLLVRDDTGRLQLAHMHQFTGHRLGNVPLRTYHLNMLKLASKAMELPVEIRRYGCMTMSIPWDTYGRLVERFEAFLDDVAGLVDESRDPEHVYHLEMSLFPLTKIDTNGNPPTDKNDQKPKKKKHSENHERKKG